MENNQLCHHGTKGMKWGIRRYQNRDGSLTPVGKRRYRKWSEDARTAATIRKKSVNKMSNSELKKVNERIRLEQEYSKLNPGAVRKGWKFVAGAAGIMGTTLALYNNSNQLISIGKKFVEKT